MSHIQMKNERMGAEKKGGSFSLLFLFLIAWILAILTF
jgi:hypothetical protein